MNYIIMGPPGSGKSTQAKLLAEFFGVSCLEAGELLYYLSQENSQRGRKIKQAMEAGSLVEGKIMVDVISKQLKSSSYKNGVVIDGFPRSFSQAYDFKFLPDKVIYVDVSDEENTKRLLKRGRKDDTPQLIKKRLQIYHRQTEPVLGFYRQRGILIKVNGEQPIEIIHQDILNKLKMKNGKGQIKTQKEIQIMKEGERRLGWILEQVLKAVKSGVSLKNLDRLAESFIEKQGGKPSFKMVPGYKWATCINVNQGVVHGIPGKYCLKEGDIVSVDMGIFYKGLHVDEAWTVEVKTKNEKRKMKNEKFLKAGEKALRAAIKVAKAGNRIGHISLAIETEIKKAGFSPIQALTGHGVGRKLHEEPQIPCYLKESLPATPLIKSGMTLAIEVIYAQGRPELVLKDDGWTLETADGSLTALFEKTVFVPPQQLGRG